MMFFFEDKLAEINEVFQKLSTRKNFIIWGAGQHTENLMRYSDLYQYDNWILADKHNYGQYLWGKYIVDADKVDLKAIDAVVISSLQYQDEIENELLNGYGFRGDIIKLYTKYDKNEFYKLQSYSKEESVYEGDFHTWEEAKGSNLGYGEANILEKVRQATLEVIAGKYAYERDSVLFKNKEFSFHILAYIAKLGIKKEKVVIVDYGGALGSTYLQNRKFLESLPISIEYNVVEQNNFVEEGKKIFKEDKFIKFRYSLDEIQEKIDLILFSGVLQYVDYYAKIILKALERNIPYIIVDRTPICCRERICIQRVADSMYAASIPVRVFKRDKLLNMFIGKYKLVYEFYSHVDGNIYFLDDKIEHKGFIFEINKNC